MTRLLRLQVLKALNSTVFQAEAGGATTDMYMASVHLYSVGSQRHLRAQQTRPGSP